jgi:hypothetical protein
MVVALPEEEQKDFDCFSDLGYRWRKLGYIEFDIDPIMGNAITASAEEYEEQERILRYSHSLKNFTPSEIRDIAQEIINESKLDIQL